MFCFCKITNPTHLPAIIISKPCLFQVHLLSERTISIRSKISKMVVVIVALFTICWGPIQIFVLFQSFYPNFKANYTTYKIKTWANCMSMPTPLSTLLSTVLWAPASASPSGRPFPSSSDTKWETAVSPPARPMQK